MEDDSALTQLQRDVLRTVRVARKSGDVRFLLGGGRWSIEDISAALDVLYSCGLAIKDASGFWTQTEAGEAALRRIDAWEVVVEDTFELTHLGTVVKGQVVSGNVHAGDFFQVDGEGLGQVLSIEVLPWRDSDPSIAFRADVPFAAGQRVTGCTPEAGASTA